MNTVSQKLFQAVLFLVVLLVILPSLVKAQNHTEWNECRHSKFSGNYYGHRCIRERTISKTLFHYLNNYFTQCVNYAASSVGDVGIKDLHIEHKGIYADERHSPNSLHASGRAIDIKSISYKKSWFKKITHNHEEDGDSRFFYTLRSCWGQVIEKYSLCPYFENDPYLTGSIGKEDENHQIHLHLSVPYCLEGEYQEPFFWR